jgi:integrase
MANGLKGRPRKYAEFDELLSSLPKPMAKRPKYLKGVGIFRGARGDTAWIKIRLPHGGQYKRKLYAPGSSLEVKLGSLSSWPWELLVGKHTELQGKADRGEQIDDDGPILFKDYAADWLDRAKPRVKDYLSLSIHVEKHLLSTFGNQPIRVISTTDVNRWVSRQLETLAPATVKRQMSTFKAILSDAERSGKIEKNPCRNADPIRGIVGRQRFLSMDELVSLLASAEAVAEWLPDFITWGVHSGMRKSEILNLVWSEVQELPDGRSIVTVSTSKADQPRMIVCTQSMKEVLERQRGRKQEGKKVVFPVSRMTLRRKWEKARSLVGLEDVTMHDLRRTHSTHAAAAGVDLRTLAGRIGHADLTMLQKHYAAIVGTAAVEAADKIEEVFGHAG